MAFIEACGGECAALAHVTGVGGGRVTSGQRSGAGCIEILATTTSEYRQFTLPSAKGTVVLAAWVKMNALPASATSSLCEPVVSGGTKPQVRVTTGGSVQYRHGTGTATTHPTTLEAGGTYFIVVRFSNDGSVASGVHTIDVWINGVQGGRRDLTEANNTMTQVRFGNVATAATVDELWDDVTVWDAASDATAALIAGTYWVDISGTEFVEWDQALTLPLLDAGPEVYAPAAQPDQFLTLGLLDASRATYAPTAAAASAGLTLPLLDGSSTVYAPTAALSGASSQGLTLPLLTSTAEVYQPVAFIGTGVVVTVDQDSPTTAGMQWKPSAYGVQRFLRQNMDATERAAAVALMDDIGVDLVTVHIGGGYSNATPSTQQWDGRDPMPAVGTYVWNSASGRTGLDELFGYLDELIALRPAAKMLLVLHDFPVAMLGGQTRASQTNFPWPSSTEWQKMGPLLSAIDARFPGSVWGASYGQELKGFTSRTDTTALNAFAAGYNEVAAYVRAYLPGWKLCYPHVNLFASWSTISQRHSEVSALIAGGDFGTADETIYATLLAAVDPADVDYLTVDYSLIDYSTLDTHTYAQAQGLITVPYHVLRRLNELMAAEWGETRDIIGIEVYADVRVADVDYLTEPQKAALTTAMSIEFARAGGTYEMRWEPHGGTPGSETTDGDMICWWNESGVAYDLAGYHQALREALPDGCDLFPTTSTSPNIVALGGGTKVVLVNIGTSAATVFVSSAGVTLDPTVIPAYGYTVLELPTPAPSGPTPVVDDQFNRTVVDGWGTADVGGVVTMNTASRFDVTPGAGTIESGTGQTTRGVYADVTLLDSEGTYVFSTSAVASGSAHETQLTLRQAATVDGDYYSVNVVFDTDQSVSLALLRRVSGVQATITGPTAIGRETHAAGRQFNVVFEARGTSPTTLRAKIWQVGTSEPGSWDISGTDSTGPQVAGSIGVRFYVGPSSSTRIATFGRVALAGFTNDLVLPLLDAGPLLYPVELVPDQLATLPLLDATATLYAPTATTRSYLTAPLLDASPALYAPTVDALPVTVTVPLLDAGATVYAPQADRLGAPGAILPLLDASPALYAPTVLPQAVAVVLPTVDGGQAVYTPAVLPQPVTATLPLADAGAAVYAPDVQPAPWDVVLPVIDGGWAVYAPAASVTAATATLPFLDAGPSVYAPELAVTTVEFLLALLDAHGDVYAPDVTPTWAMTLPVLDATAAVYAPLVAADQAVIGGHGPKGSAWSPRPASRASGAPGFVVPIS